MKQTVSIFLLLISFCCTGSLYAQKNKLSKEEFRQKQQEFIIQRAELTPDEAKKFFPLYFELQDKKGRCNREAWEKMRQGKNSGTSEAEYAQIVEDIIQARITNDNLDMEYLKKYKTFLTSKKIYDIQRAEMRFHRELLKNARNAHRKRAAENPSR